MINISDRKIEISLIPGVLNTNIPKKKKKKSGIRKKDKVLLVKILTLRKYKREITIYRKNIMNNGFTLENDNSIGCSNKGLAPKSRPVFNELPSFCTSKPTKKLGRKNISLYWRNIEIEKVLMLSFKVIPKK